MPNEAHSLTGNGKLRLTAGGQAWNQIQAQVITPGGQVQFLTGASPRKILHAGWIALAYEYPNGQGLTDEVLWWSWMEFDRQHFLMAPSIFAEDMAWGLTPGTTVNVIVFY